MLRKNLKQNCKARFHCFMLCFNVQQFKAVQLCKLEHKISFCIVSPFREAVILLIQLPKADGSQTTTKRYNHTTNV